MADLGRISGPMLKDNLLRGGVDLVFENQLGDNLLYLDVNSSKISINSDSIVRELFVNDAVSSSTFLIDDTIFLTELTIDNSSIESINNITFSPQTGVVNLSSISTSGLNVNNNVIQSLNSNETLELRPDGTGSVNFRTANVDVNGNLHSTGNITLDGSIIIGNSDADSVTIASDINSDIIPDQDIVYDLGTPAKKWSSLYTELVNGQLLETSGISVSGVNEISLRQGKIWYVATNGSDSNVGDHQNGPFASIAKALSETSTGDTVLIYPGTYTENFPLTVPSGVTVRGMGIRSVKIVPTILTSSSDAFLLNGESTVSDLTIADFFYNSTNNTGYAFKFANNFTVISRSPYIQNVSVITSQTSSLNSLADIYSDPLGLAGSYSSNSVAVDQINYTQSQVEGWIGKLLMTWNGETAPVTFYEIVDVIEEPLDPGVFWRIVLDRDLETAGEEFYQFSIYPNNGETIIVGTAGYTAATDYSRSFLKSGLPPFFDTTVTEDWTCQIGESLNIVDYIEEDPMNSNWWKVNFKNITTPTAGLPIFTSPTAGGSVPAGRGAYIDGAVANAASKEASMLFHSVTMIVPDADAVVMTNGVRVEWLNSFIYYANRGLYAINGTLGFASLGVKFGAEIRSIGSANVYGTFGAVADGANTLMYLINHNFAYIGSGTDSSNDPSNVIQANETVKLNSGKIYYQSLDHKGTFRVGDIFVVNLETGEISIDGVSTSLGGVTSLDFADNDSETFIDATTVDANNIRISGNTISSISGDVNFSSQSNEINLTQNVNISKNLDISNDFIIKGQLTVGNQVVDTVNFVSKLDEDLIPKLDNTYSIGSQLLKWDASNIENIELDNLKFFDNRIKTIETNSDLELTASGTGRIYSSGTDVEIDQDLTVNGITDIKNINVVGTIAHIGNTVHIGNSFQTGDYALTGSITVSNDFLTEDIAFIDNRISTRNSNSDLELRAEGTGRIYFPIDPVRADQNLTVVDLTTTSNITNSDTVTSDKFYVDDVFIKDNYITTYNSNSNLELTANNAGGVFLEQLKFTDNTISTASGNINISIASLSTGSVLINDEKALKIPVGTGAARPVGIQGDFRYDSTDNLFSGWSSSRVTFGGVFSADRRTNVTAHPINDTLNFVTNLVATMDITQTGIRTNGLGTDNNLLFNGNTISTLILDSNINLTPNGIGETDLGEIHIYQNEFINQNNATPLTLSVSGAGHVKFNSNTGINIPTGPSSTRPFTELGDIRWNTELNSTEIFNGIEYTSIAGVTESASPEQVQELNEIYAILLG